MMCLPVVMPMTFFNCLANEYGRQVCEDEGLDGCYQQFQEEHKDGKCNRYNGEAPTCYLAHSTKNEDHKYHAQDNDMARQHIGEQTPGGFNK